MAYIALARKYRPCTFNDFVGQEAIAKTLTNAISADKVSHAYLFCGSRGTGKTSMARVFAMALNCKAGPTITPCGECDVCRDIQAGSDLDVQELDGASNRGIDQVRALRENVRFVPNRARYRIYYIDEAHMLTIEAFNALLKTLEEPPAHVKFILASTAPSRIPDTIHSRCQRFDFRRISAGDVAKRLHVVCGIEGLKVPDDVLQFIGRRVRGSMRDGLSLLDQVGSFAQGELTVGTVEAMLGGVAQERLDAILDDLLNGNVPGALGAASKLLDSGCDAPDILEQLAANARMLLIASQCGAQPDLLERAMPEAEKLVERSKAFSPDYLIYVIQTLYEARQKTRMDLDGRIVMELALVKLARARAMGSIEDMLARLEALSGKAADPPKRSGERPPAPAAPPNQATAPTRVVEQAAPYAADGSLWDKLIAAVSQNGRTWDMTNMMRGRLKEAVGDRVVIALPDQTALRELDAPAKRAELQGLFSRALNKQIALSFVLDAADAPRQKDTADEPSGEVKQIADAFGGRVIKRRKAHDG